MKTEVVLVFFAILFVGGGIFVIAKSDTFGIRPVEYDQSIFENDATLTEGVGALGESVQSSQQEVIEVVEITAEPPEEIGLIDIESKPFYKVPWMVGIEAEWEPVEGASEYRIIDYRENVCESATKEVFLRDTHFFSSRHYNCGAPTECYIRDVTVEALDTNGFVIAMGTSSICAIGIYEEEFDPIEPNPLGQGERHTELILEHASTTIKHIQDEIDRLKGE